MLAGGKLVVALEGGYYVDSLAEGSVHVLKALLGDQPAPLRLSCPPCKSVLGSSQKSVFQSKVHIYTGFNDEF
ncbi:hypothetical protein X801_10557 [Opisthorchis viverrini]|uniref:Histone deacetylase domain-containing protein n=1 Tax=Opisthorchis viverrini TaxID=6198 RepID=A0A1S8WGT4_OPIVI|nr:hypothetical protein X801_10557 [Opisthorchis viverrini]